VISKDDVHGLATRCANAFLTSFVAFDEQSGGWSKYFSASPDDIGIWGTASGLVGLAVARAMKLPLDSAASQRQRVAAARFLARMQLKAGRDAGAWSISQAQRPAFVDTTAISLTALIRSGEDEWASCIERGLDWLAGCQLADGGWNNRERHRSDAKIAKTCPTAYSLLVLKEGMDYWATGGGTAKESWERSAARAAALIEARISPTTIVGEVASGWGRALSPGSSPEPAYSALAVDALRCYERDAFLESHRDGLRRLNALTRRNRTGFGMDDAPWPPIRDVWTPVSPLIERTMTFFTTAWIIRATAGSVMADESLIDFAAEWLVRADRSGRFFHFHNEAHGFLSMDALRACERLLAAMKNRSAFHDDERHSSSSEFEFDVFICHASEDKDTVVRPLAESLTKRGVRVWYDEYVLRLGDSLPKEIDRGLNACRFGIVVMSHNFFAKNWPRRELDGLAARETSGGLKVILPVWHGVDAAQVEQFSPTLAAKLAVSTSKGISVVAQEIERALRDL
jgi:TIR domain